MLLPEHLKDALSDSEKLRLGLFVDEPPAPPLEWILNKKINDGRNLKLSDKGPKTSRRGKEEREKEQRALGASVLGLK